MNSWNFILFIPLFETGNIIIGIILKIMKKILLNLSRILASQMMPKVLSSTILPVKQSTSGKSVRVWDGMEKSLHLEKKISSEI